MLPARVIAQRFSQSTVDGVLSTVSSNTRAVLGRLEYVERSAGTVLDPMLWATGLKRQQLHAGSILKSNPNRTKQLAIESMNRIEKNVSRLRYRRMLQIALASLAAQQFRTSMEKAVDRPSDWSGWTRKGWEDELLEQLGATKLRRFVAALNRLVQLSALAAPLLVMAPLSYVSPAVHRYSWSYALWGIEAAGPTFIKWVQWATTRQDLFSPEFCQYFGKLRDETRGHEWKFTEKVLKEDLGELTQHLQMETKPIGSGCIAQVYRGRLNEAVGQFPKGTELAIKVQHPDIWTKVCVDFYILGKVANFLERLPYLELKYLALADTVRQFRDIMIPQLDLTLEANNLERFNRDFKHDDRVNFPYPLKGLTSKRVLTETFLHGSPILSYASRPEHVRKELAKLGVDTTLRMIFLTDFLHGDLHPGNILVHEPTPGKLTLNLLDCGLVVEMGPSQHVNLTKIMGAFSRRDGRMAGQLMVDTSSDCQATDDDMTMFIEGISRICNEDSNFIEHVGDKITDICYLACRHKVKLEPAFISAALAVEIIEGIAKSLYHDIPVSSSALRFIFQAELMHNLPAIKMW